MGLELCETLIFEMSDMVDLFGLEGCQTLAGGVIGARGVSTWTASLVWLVRVLCKLEL